jgi:hypothetical protein
MPVICVRTFDTITDWHGSLLLTSLKFVSLALQAVTFVPALRQFWYLATVSRVMTSEVE